MERGVGAEPGHQHPQCPRGRMPEVRPSSLRAGQLELVSRSCPEFVSAGSERAARTGSQSRCAANRMAWPGSTRCGEGSGAMGGGRPGARSAFRGVEASGSAIHSWTQGWAAVNGPCSRTWTRHARQRPSLRGTQGCPHLPHVPSWWPSYASQLWQPSHFRHVPHEPHDSQDRGPGATRARGPRGPGARWHLGSSRAARRKISAAAQANRGRPLRASSSTRSLPSASRIASARRSAARTTCRHHSP
jgi:hypothetical protein